MIITFWLCIILLTHIYAFYPASLRLLLAIVGKRAPQKQQMPDLPKVSVIISAHNEENVIEEKIQNTLAFEYPKDKMEILIGDDGSNDRTAEILESYSSQILLLKNEKNEGKAAMLNKLCAEAKGEFLLFSDANTIVREDALKNIIAEFSDGRTGCVCGKLVLEAENFDLSKTESIYWKGESRLKFLESGFGAVMGSNGALYAIRSSLYCKLPTHKVVMDDFYITAKILMKNYASVFCENALAFEKASASKLGEFKRKIRISRANFNFLFDFLPLLSPLHPVKAYMFLSHKLLRWLSPFLLIALFSCSILLMEEHIFYKIFLSIELFFIVFALIGIKAFKYFLSMNFALFLGFCKSFFKEKGGAWKRIERG